MDCGYFVGTGTQAPLAPVEEKRWNGLQNKGEILKNSKARSVNSN